MQLIQIIQIINKYSQRFLPKFLSLLIEKYLTPEVIRYLLVGISGALVFIISSDLMYYLIPKTIVATSLGWIIGVTFSYFSHMLITFQVQAKHKTYVPRYISLIIFNLIYNLSGAWLLHDVIGIGYATSIIIISIIWPLLSYIIMKFHVFNNTVQEAKMSTPLNFNDLITIYPKTRPALPQKYQDVYVDHYKNNRSNDLSIRSIGARLERWMHKLVAEPLQEQSGKRILEVGAGNLNHVRYENNYSKYDVVEPFVELFEASNQTIDIRYDGVFEIDENNKYDKICSIAVLEHLEELPYIIAKSAFLMDKDAVFNFGIPSEGTILWKIGSDYSTGISFKKRYNLDYSYIQRYDHINTAKEIEHVCQLLFADIKHNAFGLNRDFSFYQYFECRQPNLELCQQLMDHYNNVLTK